MRQFIRKAFLADLQRYLVHPSRLLQVVTGPRQVGKTTLATQLAERWAGATAFESADRPNTPDAEWLATQWRAARSLPRRGRADTLLVLDEVQKVQRWSEAVKMLFDEDRRKGQRLRVLLLGSSALLVQRGLRESLAGRFELHRQPHWSYAECREAFRASLEDYLYFGGYPRGLAFRNDPERWKRYIQDSVIETVIGRDVLLMSPVQKPALLRQAFGMICAHPAEILSYQKMLGQLAEAGNNTTLAHYVQLLAAAHLLAPLERWSGSRLRQKISTPKFVLRDNSLVNALAGWTRESLRCDPAQWGRLVENAVGANLASHAERKGCSLYYWRDRQDEVDYVLQRGSTVVAIEVKSGSTPPDLSGMGAFTKRCKGARRIVIGPRRAPAGIQAITLRSFFLNPQQVLP